MKNIFLLLIALIISPGTQAQVGINKTDPKATFDIAARNPANPEGTEGFLIPRITSFASSNPTAAQDGMLVYMNNASAYAGVGFYYWDNDTTNWLPWGDNKWMKGTNGGGDGLIYAVNANAGGTKVVVKDDGFVGMGTDTPLSELQITGTRNTGGTDVEFTINNTASKAEFQLVPGGVGSADYTFVANDDSTNGLSIYEDLVEKVQLKSGGDLRIDDLSSSNNSGVVYPASVYVESDGTLKVKTAYSRLDDLKVNLTNFATVDYAESTTNMGTDTTASLYTYTLTPTQDILLELSYHISANFTEYGSATNRIDEKHQTKLFGTIVRVNGVNFTYNTNSFIGNSGLMGAFIYSDQLFIPLVADGSTYNISIHGYIQNDSEITKGIRATFGGDVRDRLQVIEHR
jgi:hypothetical protein